jgi:ribonuclease VapC
MTKTFLVDAWTVLAFLKKEAPADVQVVALLEQARKGTIRVLMSIINLGEVYYSVGRTRGEDFANGVLADCRLLPIEYLPADETIVFAAARWKMKYLLSYADAFAAAAAEKYSAILVTGDPELVALSEMLEIEKLERTG